MDDSARPARVASAGGAPAADGGLAAWGNALGGPGARFAAIGLLRLAIAALLVSGVYVTFVAAGRTPLVQLIAGRDFLSTALVAHVIFALDIWCLAFVATIWAVAAAGLDAPLPRWIVWPGVALTWLGMAIAAAIPLVGAGQPVMADYVPLLLHPLFVVGLIAFAMGIALVAAGFLGALFRSRSPVPLPSFALGFGAAGYLAALVAFVAAAARWGLADQAMIVWGGGHLFQLVNASALIAVWLAIVPVSDRRVQQAIRLSFGGFAVAIGAILLMHVPPLSWAHAFLPFWGGIGLPLVLAMAVVAGSLLCRGWGAAFEPPATFLWYSVTLLGVGGVIALLGLGSDVRVTAHYHASVGAVTMAFMGTAYWLLPRLGLQAVRPRLAIIQAHVYGSGLYLLVGGLFWAGSAGTARKIFEAISSDPSLIPAASIFGLGALATVVGGATFVVGIGRSLFSIRSATTAHPSGRRPRGAVPIVSPTRGG